MADKRTSVALPDDWHERITRLAKDARRSVHAEILWLIGLGLQAEETQGGSNDTADH